MSVEITDKKTVPYEHLQEILAELDAAALAEAVLTGAEFHSVAEVEAKSEWRMAKPTDVASSAGWRRPA